MQRRLIDTGPLKSALPLSAAPELRLFGRQRAASGGRLGWSSNLWREDRFDGIDRGGEDVRLRLARQQPGHLQFVNHIFVAVTLLSY